MTGPPPIEPEPEPVARLLRESAPRLLAALMRHHGTFDACEDAAQEALLAGARQWPAEGVPRRPVAWLVTVANRWLIDQWRAEDARRRREERSVREAAAVAWPELPEEPRREGDDTLLLLFLCCHPALAAPEQIALTLRAVGGLTTAEIAAAFFVPEATMAKRIGRAKQRIRASGAGFAPPTAAERPHRLAAVLHVLYLVFNEGYLATSGALLHRTDLTGEAIRLARLLHRLLPGEGEVAGLLALLLLTDARRSARLDAGGALVPLAEQDRRRWDAGAIGEGTRLLARTLGGGTVGPYQVQAAIAALHDEAPSATETDWPQILALYDVLARLAPGPMVTLSRAVACAEVHGPVAGLAVLGTLDDDARAERSHRVDAVRGHLLERAGDLAAARECYLRAAGRTASLPEQRYLLVRAARLRPGVEPP